MIAARRDKTATRRARAPAPKPKQQRGEAVIQGVLDATLHEVARAGYRALRIEDVAARAGVNKTTIYRRWPTKVELVHDALASARGVLTPIETGALRSDLLAFGRAIREKASSARNQCVVRVLVGEGSDPEVVDLRRALRASHDALPRRIVEAAIARGELAAGADHMELVSAFVGAVHHRLFMMNETLTDAFLERVVDLLLLGALQPDARPRETRSTREPRARAPRRAR